MSGIDTVFSAATALIFGFVAGGLLWGGEKHLLRRVTPFLFFSTPGKIISLAVNTVVVCGPVLVLARYLRRRREDPAKVSGAKDDSAQSQ